MRITVFGAAGNVGSRVVAEALSRGHDVTAVVRDAARLDALDPRAQARVGDAAEVADVVALSAGQDLLVSATRPRPGRECDLVSATRALLSGSRQTGVRVVLVGGAGSLTAPGGRGVVLDDPSWVPVAWGAIARASVDQLAACRADDGADWTYLSPPALLEPGARTGSYRLGRDELLVDAAGHSSISSEDLAVALLDEAERPRHRRMRFTVASGDGAQLGHD